MISALVTIREAGAEDEAALCSTWCAAWGATFPAIDYHARWPAMWRRWRDMEAEIFVAMRGKSLIGMIVLGETEADTLLDQIALDPTEQGSGTAHLLMAFAKKRAAGPMRLTVNAFNARAIRFYEREGFVRIGTGVNPNSGLATFDYEWQR